MEQFKLSKKELKRLLTKEGLMELLKDLNNNPDLYPTEEEEDQIADYYGVLVEGEDHKVWLQFIINNYA
jgi:hypothetical protein